MVITVSCPACATSFPVDPEKIPEGGVKARCSECAHVFRVERPDAEVGAEAAPEQTFGVPPMPGLEPSQTTEPAPEPAAGSAAESEPEPASAGDDWAIERDPFEGVSETGMGGSLPSDEAFPGDETPPIDETLPSEEPWPEPTPDAEPPASLEADATATDQGLPDWATGADAPELERDAPGADAPSMEPDLTPTEPSEPGPSGADVAEPSPPAEPDTSPVQGFTFGKRDPMDKARRLARVLVSDMVMYNAERHQTALARGTLAEDFEEEIEKSWKEFVEQVGDEVANGEGQRFWTQALNEILAKGQRVF